METKNRTVKKGESDSTLTERDIWVKLFDKAKAAEAAWNRAAAKVEEAMGKVSVAKAKAKANTAKIKAEKAAQAAQEAANY